MTKLTEQLRAFVYLNKNVKGEALDKAIKNIEPMIILAVAELLGYKTIYGDTDSIFLKPPEDDKHFVIDFK